VAHFVQFALVGGAFFGEFAAQGAAAHAEVTGGGFERGEGAVAAQQQAAQAQWQQAYGAGGYLFEQGFFGCHGHEAVGQRQLVVGQAHIADDARLLLVEQHRAGEIAAVDMPPGGLGVAEFDAARHLLAAQQVQHDVVEADHVQLEKEVRVGRQRDVFGDHEAAFVAVDHGGHFQRRKQFGAEAADALQAAAQGGLGDGGHAGHAVVRYGHEVAHGEAEKGHFEGAHGLVDEGEGLAGADEAVAVFGGVVDAGVAVEGVLVDTDNQLQQLMRVTHVDLAFLHEPGDIGDDAFTQVKIGLDMA